MVESDAFAQGAQSAFGGTPSFAIMRNNRTDIATSANLLAENPTMR